jgi:hypothetical protein
MANKKINELSVRTPSLSDLMLVGDPSTGYSYKATISSLSTLLEANIALNDLSDVVITSVANGNLLAYNGTNWVNRTLGAYLGGTITQYVRGDGSLGDFAGGGGGGGASVSYYLNGSVNQGTFSGNTYYEMNKTPIAGAGTNFTINANGYIASFITDAGDPALLKIPGGNWNLEFYFSSSSAGGTPSFYVELYKYDGTTFTLIASNSASPEGITNGTAIDAYFTSLSVPETVLTLTDRLAIRVYVTHSGRTITLHTENSNLCQIITTFTTGLTALNNLTAQVQFFATGTSGTDFAISSTTATHTFNLPTASGTNRGALSSADWTTFNGKVGGSGTTNYVSKFTASGTIGNSSIFDNGTDIGFNTATPSTFLAGIGGNVIFRSGTSVGQSIATASNNYVLNYLTASNQFIWYPLPSGTRAGTLFTNTGNWVFGSGSTDGGFKVDIGGTLRASGDANINGLTVGKGGGSVANNTALGSIALNSNTSGDYNTAVGRESLTLNTTGTGNISLGWASGRFQTTGNYNLYLGYGAGYYDRGSNNIFVGFQTGFHSTFSTSSNNLGVGHQALNAVDADYNIGVGFRAGYGITTGTYNTIVGSGTTANGITTGNYNTIIGSQITGLSSSLSNTIILADGQGNQRLYIDNIGEVGIGTTSPSYLLDVNGTARVSGTELRLDNGTTGVINLYSTTPEIRFASADPTNYRFYRSGTNMIWNTAGAIQLQLSGNIAYQFEGANGHIWRTGLSGQAATARLTTGGNLIVGGTTDAGYKADIQGTTRISGTELRLDNGTTGVINLFSTTPEIRFSSGSPTGYRLYRSSTSMILNSAGNIFLQIGGNDAYYVTAALGHNWVNPNSGGSVLARLDTGGSLSIGNGGTAANASSILDLTSTTKGFLPPRMTGAQAEAIGTPAAGLMVYSTDGSGATITSLGWWGYNGTTWVKLN